MKRKIAIVEDDYLLALVMCKHLKGLGYECFSFPRSSEFFHFFSSNTDLHAVILDVKLRGEKNGVELFHQLSKISAVPVIFSTGNSDILELKELKSSQVRGILIKPIQLEQLSSILEELNE